MTASRNLNVDNAEHGFKINSTRNFTIHLSLISSFYMTFIITDHPISTMLAFLDNTYGALITLSLTYN